MLAEVLEPIVTKNGILAPGKIIDVSENVIAMLSTKVRLVSPTIVAPLCKIEVPQCETRSFSHGEQSAPVRCGDCQNFQRDTVNPAQGYGSCGAGKNPSRPYPMALRQCSTFQNLCLKGKGDTS